MTTTTRITGARGRSRGFFPQPSEISLLCGLMLICIVNIGLANDNASPALSIDDAGDIQAAGNMNVRGKISGVGMTPPGGIIMFSGRREHFDNTGLGSPGTPFEGWAICNGQNGTPDLRNRFILGAGTNNAPGHTGGADSVRLSIENMPLHNHYGGTGETDPLLNYGGVIWNSEGVSTGIVVAVPGHNVLGNGNRPNALADDHPEIQVELHNHSIPQQGGSTAFDIRPPFYALYYIMRLP